MTYLTNRESFSVRTTVLMQMHHETVGGDHQEGKCETHLAFLRSYKKLHDNTRKCGKCGGGGVAVVSNPAENYLAKSAQ
jgi:hypothetical protein